MSKVNVTFNRHVKFKEDRYATGETTSVSKQEYELLVEANVIDPVEDVPKGVDYFGSTREELSKVKNDDLKAFLDNESLVYESSFTKEELINVILGEEA
jgi:hypothetical protein